MKRFVLISALIAFCVGSALAGEKEDAIKMVNEAAGMAATNKAEALAEIGNKAGRFVRGELYLFAYDLNGVMVAHPINSKLIGKDLLNVPDADGKLFRKAIIDGVKASGFATVDYKYKNPTTDKIEDKESFCKLAAELVICGGYYKK